MKYVEIPEDIAIRMVRFISIAAGEGIWFAGLESYVDELDAASIEYDWYGKEDNFPDWVPQDIREAYA